MWKTREDFFKYADVFELLTKMNVYDDRFYRLNRRLMVSVGLWPYQSPKYRKILRAIISFAIILGIVVQYVTFLTHQFNMQLVLDVMSFGTMPIAYFVKYNSMYMNSTNVKSLLEQVIWDCNAITDTQEMKIIEKYFSRGRMYAINIGIFVYLSIMFTILIMFSSDVLNCIAPLEEPRLRQIPILIAFFDQEKDFYIIVFCLSIVLMFCATTILACELLIMMFIQHACGLFTIASYRITHAFDDCKDKSVINEKLLHGIKIHKRSLQFIEFLNSYFSEYYLIFSIIVVISLNVNMLELFQAIKSKEVNNIICHGALLSAHFVHVFGINYFGQILLDHSENVFEKTYGAYWYTAPLHVQKLVIFVLQRSTRTCVFNIFAGILIASMEGFASIISLSVSYFTVLYSLQM